MKFKYRIKGLVRKPFILRSAYFSIGNNIDFYITESELEFVKERCEINEIIDLVEKSVEPPKSVLQKIENEPKGEKNGLQSKQKQNNSKTKTKI